MPSASTPRRRIAPACVVELRVHQVPAGVHHVHVEAVVLQAAGRLQAEQAAADDDRALVGARA